MLFLSFLVVLKLKSIFYLRASNVGFIYKIFVIALLKVKNCTDIKKHELLSCNDYKLNKEGLR